MLQNNEHLRSVMGRLEGIRQASEQMRQRTVEATFKASPKNKMFTVTVGGRGEFKGLVFRGDDYRGLPPAELADLLMKTFEKAREQSVVAAMQGLSELTYRSPMPVEALAGASSMDEFIDTLIESTSQSLPTADPAIGDPG